MTNLPKSECPICCETVMCAKLSWCSECNNAMYCNACKTKCKSLKCPMCRHDPIAAGSNILHLECHECKIDLTDVVHSLIALSIKSQAHIPDDIIVHIHPNNHKHIVCADCVSICENCEDIYIVNDSTRPFMYFRDLIYSIFDIECTDLCVDCIDQQLSYGYNRKMCEAYTDMFEHIFDTEVSYDTRLRLVCNIEDIVE